MFDLSLAEIAVVCLVALLVLRPEDIPPLMRSAGQMVRKIRALAKEFTAAFDEVAEEKSPHTTIIDMEGKPQRALDTSDLPLLDVSRRRKKGSSHGKK